MAKVEEAQEILVALGMPPGQRNKMAGFTLIALCGLTPGSPWSSSKREGCTVTKGIMDYIKEHYKTEYAPNTRETFRRQVLHQFVQGNIADKNPFEPDLPINSPKTHYALTIGALNVAKSYGTANWNSTVSQFREDYGTLMEIYSAIRELHTVPITIPGGKKINFSPGKHNEVQKAIVEEFVPRFAPAAQLLYLGDTAKKDLFIDNTRLFRLNIPIADHGKLPDVVVYDSNRNWLFLIEAVTSHGPVSPTRKLDLERMLTTCTAETVFVSAFPDFSEFRRHISNIAWETEVWICDTPDHMIHFDGEKFLGPSD